MDTLKLVDTTSEEIIYRILIEQKSDDSWQLWFLLVGILSVVFAVAVPYFEKKYEEFKAKNTFKKYILYYLNGFYGTLVSYPVQYSLISDDCKLKSLSLSKSINNFKIDYKKFYKTKSSVIANELIYNLQSILLGIYRSCSTAKALDLDAIKEKTLAYGDKITKDELNNIYAVIATIENLANIAYYNDVFSKLESTFRVLKNGIWVGIDKSNPLKSEETVFKELQLLYDHKNQIISILGMTELTTFQLEVLFEHYKGKKIKVESDTFEEYF